MTFHQAPVINRPVSSQGQTTSYHINSNHNMIVEIERENNLYWDEASADIPRLSEEFSKLNGIWGPIRFTFSNVSLDFLPNNRIKITAEYNSSAP